MLGGADYSYYSYFLFPLPQWALQSVQCPLASIRIRKNSPEEKPLLARVKKKIDISFISVQSVELECILAEHSL